MDRDTSRNARRLAVYCAVMIAGLWVIGLASHEELRHFIQTLPLWIGVVLGFRRSEFTKWAALPFFIFWFAILLLIWLYLLGISRIIRGHYSPTEIAMTVVVGAVALAGIVGSLRTKTPVKFLTATGIFLLTGALQVGAMAVSLMPAFRSR
jgi:hypothetical protein